MDTEALCKHPFDELINRSGIWTCECGANGTLAPDENNKLHFWLQPPVKGTRAQHRRMMRGMMRNIKKAGKRQNRQMNVK